MKSFSVFGFLVIVGSLACSTETGMEPAPANGADASLPQTAKNLGPLFYVVDTVRFPEEGEALGFNLDGGDNSEFLDAASCERFDGAAGVDNQLGEILRFLEKSGIPIRSDVQKQIQQGVVLFVIEIDQIQDLVNDSSVSVRIHVAQQQAMQINGFGRFAPGQQVALDTTAPVRNFSAAAIVNGQLRAGPGSMQLRVPYQPDTGPLVLLDVDVREAQLQMNVSETELSAGTAGGAISADQLTTSAQQAGFDELAGFSIKGTVADLSPVGGECQEVSTGFGLSATSVTLK